jgi:nucleoid-associated protein YgaU
MTTVTELLRKAKKAIESGDASLREAAEAIAAAERKGASQRQIADAVGKSAAWVNRLSQWRRVGYRDDTPFGPQAKAARNRAQSVHSAEHKKQTPADPAGKKSDAASDARTEAAKAAAAKARADADKAKADAAKAKADAQKAKADAERAKAEARTAKANERAKAHSFQGSFESVFGIKAVNERSRSLLVKTLGMLGSDQAGERATAALMVEKQRTQLSMTWDELIIPAET